ncbi:hypothetical protein XOC_0254 [Xanthomonas oryzae pv. oryzicola BLS256]|uniref:Uncharacterized protein n=1 Tax=Xanthomonas oryzae pv. oryzicola (strain BLS256) TaxID=383407 RepID=G7TKH6_XANOB|nr:hypothetical protein XOC_0254 [Xanthomonas oryzae pv. oryzicola BLS256]PUE94665.1 hypothetical protein C7T79_11335 [Xanthomonas oryzae pv. oryzicola]
MHSLFRHLAGGHSGQPVKLSGFYRPRGGGRPERRLPLQRIRAAGPAFAGSATTCPTMQNGQSRAR